MKPCRRRPPVRRHQSRGQLHRRPWPPPTSPSRQRRTGRAAPRRRGAARSGEICRRRSSPDCHRVTPPLRRRSSAAELPCRRQTRLRRVFKSLMLDLERSGSKVYGERIEDRTEIYE